MDQLSVAKMVMKTTASGEWSCGVKVALNARGITVEAARLFTQDQLIAERKCVNKCYRASFTWCRASIVPLLCRTIICVVRSLGSGLQ